MPRINLGKAAPELYQIVADLDAKANEKIIQAGIPEGFGHLLRLRASQINQCAFCIRLHARDALQHDESLERITLLNAWRESAYFSDKEQAALSLVEEMTLIADHQVSDRVYLNAAELLTETEIAAIEWLTIVINSWNRIAIASRYPVKP
ncbi:AhpD family alkylhydroperoxidase [Acinetobacter calcoaceticus]|uniref:AhpD family alkylhydroperoxidase n=1 Tax=Acinetobacter calcoaceticus TaxID=471 RepID=A0A4R1Y6C0_ACICA|nr:AhpD family alkylhydroperoxidase [Acinetobacter calcoaceticus]